MDITVKNGNIVITAALGAGTPSASGKTLIVATTSGFVPVPGSDLRVSLNVIKARK